MSTKARASLAAFVIVALAAILPPLFLLTPPEATVAPSCGFASLKAGPSGSTTGAAGVITLRGSPAIYTTPAVGSTLFAPVASVIYVHDADSVVIGCACASCQRFRRN